MLTVAVWSTLVVISIEGCLVHGKDDCYDSRHIAYMNLASNYIVQIRCNVVMSVAL